MDLICVYIQVNMCNMAAVCCECVRIYTVYFKPSGGNRGVLAPQPGNLLCCPSL